MKIFDIDGPVIQFLNKMADLMLINILTMVCCIPIITAGAAFTAMHYMALKIVRDEECYITRGYFKSFRENFRQSTIIWLLLLLVAVILGMDFYIIEKSGIEFSKVFQTIITMFAVMADFTAVMVFPIQAKFGNPIKNTLKNAFAVSILQFPKTFAMIILLFFPVALCMVTIKLFPVAFMFGFSLPAYLSAQLYNKTFLKMEKQFEEAHAPESAEAEEAGEDERIFKDELDESLVTDDKMQ